MALGQDTATALARGGRVSITQIAVDAFGNALGASLGQQIRQGGQQEQTLSQAGGMTTGDFARMDGAGYRSQAPGYIAGVDGTVGGYSSMAGTPWGASQPQLDDEPMNPRSGLRTLEFVPGRDDAAVQLAANRLTVKPIGGDSLDEQIAAAKAMLKSMDRSKRFAAVRSNR